jgi:hypothetical protein
MGQCESFGGGGGGVWKEAAMDFLRYYTRMFRGSNQVPPKYEAESLTINGGIWFHM